MSKDKLTDYDATASNNTDVGGISVAEGMLPSGVNNAIREQMSHLKDFASGTTGIDVLSLADDDASHAIKLQAPSAVTADTTFTLPDGDGASGQTMITDGAGALAWAAPYGNRNLIINGAMQASQRGDSTGKTATGYYGPDRYQLTLSSLGTWSISQSSTAPSGFGNSYKLEATTNDASPAASDYALFLQKFEGQNLQQLKKGTASAESVTLSFWVRSSKIGTYIVELFDNDNSRSISASYTISVANTFEYKTITFAGDTTGAFDDDSASSLEVVWWLASGTDFTSGTLNTSWGTRTNANIAVGQVNMADTANATWYITGVQLEVGSATPFEHRSFGDELARCQRYFQRLGEYTTSSYPVNGQCYIYGSTNVAGSFQLISSMRASSPTVSFPNGNFAVRAGSAANSQYEFSSINSNQGATQGVMQFDATVASGIQVNTIGVVVNAGTNRYMFVDAEL